jgi:hypothetical protein
VEYLEVATALVDPGRITGNTRHYRGNLLPPPYSLKIVQLSEDLDAGYYLLYLDAAGAEMTDTWHDSVEAAMAQAEFEFGLMPSEWNRAQYS